MTAARTLRARVAVTLAAAIVAAGAGLVVSRADADGALPAAGSAGFGRVGGPGGFGGPGGPPGAPPATLGTPPQAGTTR